MTEVLEIPTISPSMIAPSQSKTGTQAPRTSALLTTPAVEADGFGASTDFHFPVSFFEGDDSDIQDILDDLNIFPDSTKGTMESMEPGLPTSSSFVPATAENPLECRPVSPSASTTSCSESSKSTIDTSESPQILPLMPSLENATNFSVPNPILEVEESNPEEETATSADIKRENKKSSKKEGAASGMKRKLSGISSDEKEELTEEELLERRERNRSHAKKSRQRKKSLTQTIQQSVELLKEENQKLREEIYQIIGKQKVEDILNKQKQSAKEDFMAGLMDPKNRVVKGSAISFFKALRRSVPKRDEE